MNLFVPVRKERLSAAKVYGSVLFDGHLFYMHCRRRCSDRRI
jgi:hypothetical protein